MNYFLIDLGLSDSTKTDLMNDSLSVFQIGFP